MNRRHQWLEDALLLSDIKEEEKMPPIQLHPKLLHIRLSWVPFQLRIGMLFPLST